MSDALLALTIGFAAGMIAGIVSCLLISVASARRAVKLREQKELAMEFSARE